MRQVLRELEHLQRRGRRLLLTQRLSAVGSWIMGGLLALIAIDFFLRLPSTPRLVLNLGAGLALLWGLRAYLWPAICFRPALVELALRAERNIPSVAGHLASSVEFVVDGTEKSNALAARSVRDTESRLSGETLDNVLSSRRAWREAATLGFVLVLTMAGMIASPATARIGLSRLLAPYGATEWPARTGVSSAMGDVVSPGGVHPRGQALLLRARVTKGQPDHVGVRYRLLDDEGNGRWLRLVMTDQGDDVHERLIDTDADGITFYFETDDARTRTEHIDFVEPPAVRHAALRATPPPYAESWFAPMSMSLGNGLDERARTESPLLVGSTITLDIELNKPLPLPASDEAVTATFGWRDDEPSPTLTAASTDSLTDHWTLSWTLRSSRRLTLQLLDEHGLANTDQISFQVDAVEDRPPSVTIIDPATDEPVLPTAVVPIVVESRDDVAVVRLAVEAGLLRMGSSDETVPMWERSLEARRASAILESELTLSDHELQEGDIVVLQGVANDVYDIDGVTHEQVRSAVRRLRIMSVIDFAQRIRQDLAVVRQNAIRIEALQSELQDDVIAEGPQPGIERAQARLGERIADQREATGRLNNRIELNRLDDEQLAGLVDQVADLLDFAGRAANEAVAAIEQRQQQLRADGEQRDANDAAPTEALPPDAAAPEVDDPDADDPDADDPFADVEMREIDEADRPIVDAQQEVREELTDLIKLLDRDEDTWVATRWLEDLMQAQAQLEQETAEVGRQTIGRDFDQLDAEQQSELRRIAERQSELSAQSRALLEDLRERAEDLQDIDRAAAESLRDAARTGEQQELTREMDNASDRLEQNQLRTARGAQQAAQEAMEEMLDELRDTKRANAQELIRRLASLIESVERLVVVQENEIIALATARETEVYAGRDRAMIRLNQNTQAVADEARATGQEARRIARLLDRGADAQGTSVVALRADPIDAEAAASAEERSLELLEEALELARELEQTVEQREQERKREELIASYRALAERQVALRNQTEPLVTDEPLGRRELVDARRIGQSQDELRVDLDELRSENSEVNDSLVFNHVHQRIDGWSREVSDALAEGDVEIEVTDRQQQIADAIGRLMDAIESSTRPPDEFAQQGQGGQGQQGQQGQQPLIPPIAELKLIRGMQEQVYNLTRGLDARPGVERARREQRLRELGRDQRDLKDLGDEIVETLKEQQGPSR